MSQGFFVNRAQADDVRALAALAAAAFSHPWNEAQIRAEVERTTGGGVLVARSGAGAPCGSCAYRVAADEAEILDVAVHPSWRRRGVARFLVRLAMRRAEREGARVALLEVRAGNNPARTLYASLGFTACGLRRDYYREPVEDAVLMRCEPLSRQC